MSNLITEKFETFFLIDGGLEEIEFKGPTNIRFPEELAEYVIERFSQKGDLVFDPFCGFGTTLRMAEKLKRHYFGFEQGKKRTLFTRKLIKKPENLINDKCQNIANYPVPKADLLLTSPPYRSFRPFVENGLPYYLEDCAELFKSFKNILKPHAFVVVEISNVKRPSGVETLAWDVGKILADIFFFHGEMIRCNKSDHFAGPGFNHSYLLVYSNDTPK